MTTLMAPISSLRPLFFDIVLKLPLVESQSHRFLDRNA